MQPRVPSGEDRGRFNDHHCDRSKQVAGLQRVTSGSEPGRDVDTRDWEFIMMIIIDKPNTGWN